MQSVYHMSAASVDGSDSTTQSHQSQSSPPLHPLQTTKPVTIPEALVDIDEVLKHLKVISSYEEEFLVGGYDNGLVRVWAVQNYSITTLKGLLVKYLLSNNSEHSSAQSPQRRHHLSVPHTLEDSRYSYSRKKQSFTTSTYSGPSTHHSKQHQDFGYGLTISPIMLLHEFKAHATPLIARKQIL